MRRSVPVVIILCLAGCSYTLGKTSTAKISQLPPPACVTDTLATFEDVSDIELRNRTDEYTQNTDPDGPDPRVSETVAFQVSRHSYSIRAYIIEGKGGKVTISGVNGNVCPSAEYLETYDRMIEFVEPALASTCFDNAAFKRRTSRRCRSR